MTKLYSKPTVRQAKEKADKEVRQRRLAVETVVSMSFQDIDKALNVQADNGGVPTKPRTNLIRRTFYAYERTGLVMGDPPTK